MTDGQKPADPVRTPEVVEDERRNSGAESTLQDVVASFFQGSSATYHPIFDKFQTEHVTQFLDQTSEADTQERQLRRTDRWFRLVYVLLATAIFVFLTLYLLPDHAALYIEILKSLGIFGAGVAGGYGIKTYQEQRSKDTGEP